MSNLTTIAEINGQEHTLIYNPQTNKYEVQVSAPTISSWNKENHAYEISITATDEYGNKTTINKNDETFGDDLLLRVKNTICPIVSEITPSSSAFVTTSQPLIKFKAKDVNVGMAFVGVSVDELPNENNIHEATLGDDDFYSFNLSTALLDGEHSIYIVARNNDGNIAGGITWQQYENELSAEQIALLPKTTFVIDTLAPSLSVSSPSDNFLTNISRLTVIGNAGDLTSEVSVEIQVGDAIYENIELDEERNFSQTADLSLGENTIIITATDEVHKSTSITRIVKYSDIAPIFETIQIEPNPLNTSGLYTISVSFAND